MRGKIARGVFMVGGPGMSAEGDACIYVVEGEKGSALIDAGTGLGTEEVLANCERAGLELISLRYLILTHSHIDHSRGAFDFRERLGVKILAHQKCAEILAPGNDPRTAAAWYGLPLPPLSIDLTFEGEEYRLSLGETELVCLHTPGHSPDSISIYLDRDDQRLLFGQDIHGPLHPILESNEAQWKQSLKKLLGLKADVLCEGHFGIFRPRSAVEKYIRSYLGTEG